MLLLWISSSWIFSMWKAGAVTWEHCATYYLCCTLCKFFALCTLSDAQIALAVVWDFFALCMIGLRVPTYIFQLLHPSSLRTHTATEPIDPLQMYVIAGLFAQAQAFCASYSNLFHQPVLSPCALISLPAILLLDTLTSSAPVWLAGPHLLDTLTSFTPFEQCKGETTSDCLTDFATLSEQTGPVCECC